MNVTDRPAVTSRTSGDTAILDIGGEYSRLTASAPTLSELIKAQLDEGRRQVLVNYEKAGFIDSFAIGELITGFTSTQNLGGSFKICGLSSKIEVLFKITRLDKVFDIYPDERAALEAFAVHPKPR